MIIIGIATAEVTLDKTATLETEVIGTATAEVIGTATVDPILDKSETLIGVIGTVTTNTMAEEPDFGMVTLDWVMGELFLLET
jgi:hypothetical protein